MQRGVHSALSCKKALEQNVEQVGLNRKSRTAELYLLRSVIFTSYHSCEAAMDKFQHANIFKSTFAGKGSWHSLALLPLRLKGRVRLPCARLCGLSLSSQPQSSDDVHKSGSKKILKAKSHRVKIMEASLKWLTPHVVQQHLMRSILSQLPVVKRC